jgi:hypothetical protein
MINGGFSSLTGTLALSWHNRDANGSYQIRIWGDDRVLYTSPLMSGGILPIDFNVNVAGVNQLSIERLANGNAEIAIVNAGFHTTPASVPPPAPQITQLSGMPYFAAFPRHDANGWLMSDGRNRVIGATWRDNRNNTYQYGGIVAGVTNMLEDATGTNWSPPGGGSWVRARNMADGHNITYLLNGGYNRFTGTIAVAWDNRYAQRQYSIRIWGDGAVLYTSPPITGHTAPSPFDISVAGVTQLTIGRTAGGNAEIAIVNAAFHGPGPAPMPSLPPADTYLTDMENFGIDPGAATNGWVFNNGSTRIVASTIWPPWRDNALNAHRSGGIVAGNSNMAETATGTDWSPPGGGNWGAAKNRADGSSITYLINQRYTWFTGTIALDYNSRNAQLNYQIRIWGDNILLYSSPMISGGTLPFDFGFSVAGVSQLRIERIAGGNAEIAILNPGLHFVRPGVVLRQGWHETIGGRSFYRNGVRAVGLQWGDDLIDGRMYMFTPDGYLVTGSFRVQDVMGINLGHGPGDGWLFATDGVHVPVTAERPLGSLYSGPVSLPFAGTFGQFMFLPATQGHAQHRGFFYDRYFHSESGVLWVGVMELNATRGRARGAFGGRYNQPGDDIAFFYFAGDGRQVIGDWVSPFDWSTDSGLGSFFAIHDGGRLATNMEYTVDGVTYWFNDAGIASAIIG